MGGRKPPQGERVPTEIESPLVAHPKVAEAAVGPADKTTAQAVSVFVTLRGSGAGDSAADSPGLTEELRDHVQNQIGATASRDKS